MKSLPQLLLSLALATGAGVSGDESRPNLLIIHTDEHNFRTLGCYRALLPEDQAFMWGKGVAVETPHIDSLARDGALFTSFYAASPVCTPSRASFITGLYPVATGSPVNDMPLHDHMVTFAEVLKRNGYATSYVGKWHLDGKAKPGWEPERKFGFEDNRYMYNRGHWKILEETDDGPKVVGTFNEQKNQYRYDIADADETSFTTDFLVNRALEIMERDKEEPFCLMLSIPDPHGPNTVRAPYDTMYDHFTFEQPVSMRAALKDSPAWSPVKGKNSARELNQGQLRRIFGMVKCIDDNVGRILQYLDDTGLAENTIVIFTSDHGDSMGEHAKHNKGTPWESSAMVPFIIRYPDHVRPGKRVHTAYTTADFMPTILGVMDVDTADLTFHGVDGSDEFLAVQVESTGERIIYITNAGGRWVAAANHRYKLVLSHLDEPWLFDLESDPHELVNLYRNPDYKAIGEALKIELIRQMKAFNEPALEKGNLKYN
ncbi:MAG: sulfatase [Puniceicoccaceae bacterium]